MLIINIWSHKKQYQDKKNQQSKKKIMNQQSKKKEKIKDIKYDKKYQCLDMIDVIKIYHFITNNIH